MIEDDFQPTRKKKKRSEAYKARKAEKRRQKGENARSQAGRQKRRNAELRRSRAGLESRRNNDLRLSLRNLEARRDTESRRSSASIDARLDRDSRRSAAGLEARRDNDARRSSAGIEARKDNDSRRSSAGLAARRDNDSRRSAAGLEARRDNDSRRSAAGLKARRNRSRSDFYRQRLIEEYDDRRHDITILIDVYELAIRRGPTFTCQCCGCLFFLEAIQTFKKSEFLEKLGDFFADIYCLPVNTDDLWLCITCARDINRRKVPRICLNNGLRFPDIPQELIELTPLEERLVSPRLPFMQIRELRIGKQYGIRGNVVNVPISLEKSIDILPRTFDKTETIQLLLKRMRTHKSSYINEFIRPCKVYEAAKLLVQKPLFIQEGVTLSIDWNEINNEEVQNFFVDKNDDQEEVNPEENPDDNWDETVNDLPLNPNKEETLLKEGIVFAPGEGEKPLAILSDKYVEELAFPKIFCGEIRSVTSFISYSDICRSELKRADRRCCTATNIFFKYRKKEMEQLRNAIQTHLRKGYLKDGQLSAQQALDSDYLNSLLDQDQAYNVLKGDRSSPAYWQSKMRELMAMIRQLGIPNFFLTLSAAETRWSELLVILVKILKNEDITEEQAFNLSFQEKSELIRQDPVTCARYFDHRVRQLFKVIKAPCGPFGSHEIQDSYIRVEFQSRGSPHIHCLLWLKDAPVFDPKMPACVETCEKFIDNYISCRVGIIPELEGLQYHKHSGTCKKTTRDNNICRFGIPHFPMKNTAILIPLKEDDLTEDELNSFDQIMYRIENELNRLDSLVRKKDQDIEDISFEAFLDSCDVTEETYIRVIRNSLKRPQVFLKRDPKEIRTNAYNGLILELHRANMDLQFILDPYACVHYILNYINKSNRGMSLLLKQVVDECKSGNVTHRQKLNRISSKFLNCSEVSIQEAVYILLGMNLSKASLDTIFINTGERSNRTRILKLKAELEKLDPDSKDVMSNGILDYYVNRPDELNNCCLADFAAKFTLKKLKEGEVKHDTKNHHLKNGLGIMVERKRPKVIRYRKYQVEKDRLNYYREKVMLYLPWRDEDSDILQKDVQKIYEDNIKQIRRIEKQYVHDLDLDLEAILQVVEEEHQNASDILHGEAIADEFAHLDHNHESSIENELREKGHNEVTSSTFLSPHILSDINYSELIRSLNEKQRNFLLGLMNMIKTSNSKPFHIFLTGGAGTGKSLLIKSVYQTLNRFYNRNGGNPDHIKVLMVGPTGKSAFNIRGTTLHSAFHIPVTQCGQNIKNLSSDTRQTMYSRLSSLKLIIIDEVSMVGSKMLGILDHRLKEIFKSTDIFGGISILFVGDFNQLRPVMDSFAFEPIARLSYSIIAGSILWENVRLYHLTEIMRQKDDLCFANALNRLAIGQLTDSDKSLFESRLLPKDSHLLPNEAIRLFSRNRQVDAYNQRILNLKEGQTYICSAIDSANEIGRAKHQALFIVSQLPTQSTYNLPKDLSLKVGIRYMISTNLDIEDGLVNGASGILREINLYLDDPKTLWIEFDEPDIGVRARTKAGPHVFNGKALTPIERVVRDIQAKTEGKQVLVSRKQFPLVIAEAITIHKAQGQTYEQVVIDMTNKLDLAKFYTAFSRAKSLSGLYLVGDCIIFPKERPTSSNVSIELQRLESEAPLNFNLKFLKQLKPADKVALLFQNLPYLFKHSKDLSCDQNIMACDLLALVETRSFDVQIDGFEYLYFLESKKPRPFGIALYLRKGILLDSSATTGCDMNAEQTYHFEFMKVDLKFAVLFIFYVSPKYPKIQFMVKIEQILSRNMSRNMILIGDWNIDTESSNGKDFNKLMNSFGLKIYPENPSSSTDYGTTIDYLFASAGLIEDAFYYESIVSDHKPLISILNKD